MHHRSREIFKDMGSRRSRTLATGVDNDAVFSIDLNLGVAARQLVNGPPVHHQGAKLMCWDGRVDP